LRFLCQYQFKVNNKAKGSRNERRSMALLEAAGYSCTRAAASLGVFDIIGISSTGNWSTGGATASVSQT